MIYQPISGSLQTSRISYGVETAGKNYGQNYNSTTWYSDIPNNGQFYTIISDNYTANYYVSRSNAGGAYVEGGLPAVDEYSAPVFWVTPGTSSLDVITIVNGLPDRIGQVPFNSGSQALNWVASSSNYFAVGPDYYAQIDADNLGLYLDANQVISYPTTQSTWYDISGNTNNGTLYNGPVTWDSNGWFDFDGTDDDVNLGLSNIYNFGTASFSIETFLNLDDLDNYNTVFTKQPITRLGGLHLCINSSGYVVLDQNIYADTITCSPAFNTTTWQHFVFVRNYGNSLKVYRNGTQVGNYTVAGALSRNLNNTQSAYIARTGQPYTGYFNGQMNGFKIYPDKGLQQQK
jgi:hypothetical protein